MCGGGCSLLIMSPSIRTVPTASGAKAVQVIWGYENRRPVIDHIGSARSDEELVLLKAQAQRLIDGGQGVLDLGIDTTPVASGSASNPVAVTAERAGWLLDAISAAYRHLGLDVATDNDQVFYDLVAARIIHPGSKLDSIETLAEVGVESASYRTITRRLPVYATEDFRDCVTRALATHAGIGPGVMVLYDVTTLYFETDTPDDLRKPGYSKERRLEPQITVGLLTDQSGFPLSIGAFEGNKAETHTMLPMIRRLQDAYGLDDVTIVADAGMFSAGNKQAIVDAGLHYILGTKERDIPAVIQAWLDAEPDRSWDDYVDGQIWVTTNHQNSTNPTATGSVTYYQYSSDRARRSRRGIREQLDKARRAVEGKAPIKRNRYVNLKAPDKVVNFQLAEKHLTLAGIKGYETNRSDLTAEQVIGAYRRLFRIEKSFRMAKSDLQARPIYHRKQESIHAHLVVVMAAMGVGHVLEQTSGLSLKRLVRTLKKYRTFTIQIGKQVIHAQSPIPDKVAAIIAKLPQVSD